MIPKKGESIEIEVNFNVIENGEIKSTEVKKALFNKPDFDQLIHCISIVKHDNYLASMFQAGKQMIDFCCIEMDECFKNDTNCFLTLCKEVTNQLVMPELNILKKK